ncbi:ATP-dependent helicase [Acidiphilium cryptum]|uniref:DNA 3'-5' helicase n=1 Tax=Acidiphilium cryptum (strain JF-5) TaxID=349163 RepID=A5FWN2_ACICJ|nr:ATP-dependent helicase [Acidiphilium cryptum]ABQ30014.1 UvrD/REP helicase [Acidiphilium cryptum JF-5]
MTPELQAALDRLSPTQRQAVDWEDGAALVLAGPGVGKTTVLTTRIARILDSTAGKNFRILALTFTTKAGDEMRERVEAIVPGLAERTVIGTFHSFCAQVLRQHGSHLAIKPDFGIYDQDEDRAELLKDALEQAASHGAAVTADDTRWLRAIDQLRSSLVSPQKAAKHFRDPKAGERAARVYEIYENALRERNIMDFNGMILDTCRLAHQVPAVAARIRQSYPYWLLDEFQDTTPAQYRLIRFLAGDKFKNVFVVADDDQIIYQWAGASYRQIAAFREHFAPDIIQLVENRRCPPEIVQAANNLIAHNAERTPGKQPLVPTRPSDGAAIIDRAFATETEEAQAIAQEIAAKGEAVWGRTAVLGRTRAILQPVLDELRKLGVAASIATRRDRFVSPQFVWLQSCLDLSLRPTDRRAFTTMAAAANRITGIELDVAILAAEARSSDASLLEYWALAANNAGNDIASSLAEFALRLVQSRSTWRKVVSEAIAWLPQTADSSNGIISDAEEDRTAWETAAQAIRVEKGSQPDLDELLQGIALRPKEPPLDPSAVRLLTIHAAKGLEFEYVWVTGVAEQILPSWQSLKAGASPAELEEERRNFFVAVTRTQKQLVLTHAAQYRGWQRQPSRFLAEMNLSGTDTDS